MTMKSITAADKTIHYAEFGSGPAILYIHGNIASHVWWERVMDIPGYRCIAPDMVNFGESDRITSSHPVEYAKYLMAFLEALDVSRCILVGHSLGGAVAFEMAFAHPDKFDGLVLLDGCPIDGLPTPEAYHPVIRQYLTDRNLFTMAMKGIMGAKAADEELVSHFIDEAYKMNQDSYIGHAVVLGEVNYRESCKKWHGPSLFIRGGDDPLITAEHAEATSQALHCQLVTVPGISHCLNIEDPDKFMEILNNFLLEIKKSSD